MQKILEDVMVKNLELSKEVEKLKGGGFPFGKGM